jgi:hypothetical protein
MPVILKRSEESIGSVLARSRGFFAALRMTELGGVRLSEREFPLQANRTADPTTPQFSRVKFVCGRSIVISLIQMLRKRTS